MKPFIRIKCTNHLGNVAYIHRFNDGKVTCMLANSIPAALSYAGVLGDEVAFKAQISDMENGDDILAMLNLCKPRGQTYEWVNRPVLTGHAADIAAAKQKLLEVLAERYAAPAKPCVNYWEPPGQGLRVARITWENVGGEVDVCIMDGEGAAAFYFAERYLLAILFEEDEEVQEAREALLRELQ